MRVSRSGAAGAETFFRLDSSPYGVDPAFKLGSAAFIPYYLNNAAEAEFHYNCSAELPEVGAVQVE